MKMKGHLEVVRLLIDDERFNCLNEKDVWNQTALHLGKYLYIDMCYFK